MWLGGECGIGALLRYGGSENGMAGANVLEGERSLFLGQASTVARRGSGGLPVWALENRRYLGAVFWRPEYCRAPVWSNDAE